VTFATPIALVLVALLPMAVFATWLWDRGRRRALLEQLGDRALVAQLAAAASPRRRAVKMALLGAAGCALALALARPQRLGVREVELRGLDVVIALDASTSMLVSDAPGQRSTAPTEPPATRLAHARRIIAELVDALPGDRIGPVVFAAAATHFPLTEDHEVALQFFGDLGPQDLPRGSNLAEALRVGQCLLRRDLSTEAGCAVLGRRGDGGRPLGGRGAPAADKRDGGEGVAAQRDGDDDRDDELIEREERGRVIVVVTDGEESEQSSAAALAEVGKARELGIATVLVGVGSAAGGPVPEVDDDGQLGAPKRDDRGAPVISRRADAQLARLAVAAGDRARYVVGDARADPSAILRVLEQVSRGVATRKTREKRDVFTPLVFAALLLLLVEAAIATRRR
jgi:von Willebrand factor type A domain